VLTLARRGYRFVAPVERIVSGQTASSPRPEETSLAIAASGAADQSTTQADPSAVPAQLSTKFRSHILSSPEELPTASFRVVQTLFVLMQVMYLGFYVGALANLPEIEDLFSPLPESTHALTILIVTAAILIPVRAFVFCAVIFHAPGARQKFLKIWPYLLVFDVLWALSPFLLLHHINFGLALACTTLLVYSPFAQRSLVLMGAGEIERNAGASKL
jgi:hypothetical protein